MIDIADKKWYWVTATMLAVLIGGSWVYLTPTDKYDTCVKSGNYGDWYNVTETVYVNEKLSAIGKYRCDPEDSELWCGRVSGSRCYYVLEETTIPKELQSQTKWHTKTTDITPYSNNRTNVILHSGMTNVFENGKWVRIEDSTKSLKDDFYVDYVDKEDGLETSVIDFGYDWIELEFTVTDTKYLRQMIPFKIDGIEDRRFLWNNVGDKRTARIEIDNVFSHNYSLGKSSTTIVLGDDSGEDLADMGISGSDGSDTQYIMIVKWNITQVPDGSNIDNVLLNFYYACSGGTAKDIHFAGLKNQLWDEGSTDMTNIPIFNDTTQSLGVATGWKTQNITVTFKYAYSVLNYDNFTITVAKGNRNLNYCMNSTHTDATCTTETDKTSSTITTGDSIAGYGKSEITARESSTNKIKLNITYSSGEAPVSDHCWNQDDRYVPILKTDSSECKYYTLTEDFGI